MTDRATAKEGRRRIVAPDGTQWDVYERRARSCDACPTLIFDSEGFARRVRHYPESWRTVAADELYRASWET